MCSIFIDVWRVLLEWIDRVLIVAVLVTWAVLTLALHDDGNS